MGYSVEALYANTLGEFDRTRLGLGTPVDDPAIRVQEYTNGIDNKIVFTFNSYLATLVGSTTAFLALKLYDFPLGVIQIGGVLVKLTLTGDQAAQGLTTSSAVVGGIGTAACTQGATLLTTECDIVPSTACTLSTFVGAFANYNAASNTALTDSTGGTPATTLASIGDTSTGDRSASIANSLGGLAAQVNKLIAAGGDAIKIFDGHTTAKDLYLNFSVPDAGVGSDAAVYMTITGTIVVFWRNFGDYD